MDLINVSIRISPSDNDQLKKLYGKATPGAQIAIEGYLELQKRTFLELKGKFQANELKALLDNLNGTMRQTNFMANPKLLWEHCLDGSQYDDLFNKWDIDHDIFEKKIKQLSSAQAFFLQDAVFRAWESGMTIDDFVKSLSHE